MTMMTPYFQKNTDIQNSDSFFCITSIIETNEKEHNYARAVQLLKLAHIIQYNEQKPSASERNEWMLNEMHN